MANYKLKNVNQLFSCCLEPIWKFLLTVVACGKFCLQYYEGICDNRAGKKYRADSDKLSWAVGHQVYSVN